MKKEKIKLEYRMYGLVMYNLSPIQQGIQFGHAVVEYANRHFNTPEYQKFATKDKTFIVLNGGTSNDGKRSFYGLKKHIGSMEEHAKFIKKLGVKLAVFNEPDLNYALSAFVFLVDERVWNKKKYPAFNVDWGLDFTETFQKWDELPFNDHGKQLARKRFPTQYEKWLESIGGKSSEILRAYLGQFKFA